MAKKFFDGFMSSLFEYDSYACNFEKDIENVAPGQPPRTTLKLIAQQNQPIHFSYAPQKGLNLSGSAGGALVENILGKLLAIPDGDIDAYIAFFTDYGFLYPVSQTDYEAVDANVLMELVNRIKATVMLMNSIAAKKNYTNILIGTTYLLYSEPIAIHLSTGEYSTCVHEFTSLVHRYSQFPNMSRNQEVFDTKKFSVADTLFPPFYQVDIEYFNQLRGSTEAGNMRLFKNLFAMYTGLTDAREELRTVIDFFFHYQKEVGVFSDIGYRKIRYLNGKQPDNFTDEMKAALLKIANIVLSEEINYNIAGVHPRYSTLDLKPAWELDNLIQALYFSIFYMKPGVEIYKRCKNPTCKRDVYFLVNATATNKEYCCPKCANAAAQRRSRERKLSQQ
ncbi:hypothetical protein [Acutalibacter muris]|uniref:hypothetical protein n=1 Tax=Acutalibacter muris TaxID=1796620 RepID=UPI002729A599|nr:hypothetical protein [Acutalibacter muris]